MRRLVVSLAVWAMAVTYFSGLSLAADDADPTGVWKWSFTFNNQTHEVTLKLKLEDGKLTGTMQGPNNQERPIENANYKDGEVAFTVTRERDNRKFTTKYKGKVAGDTLRGTVEFERNGETRSRDWEAKREKA